MERKDLVISTKLFGGTRDPANNNPNMMCLSRKHLTEGVLESLKRMQLDYVDPLFCHRPDPSVHIEETVRAMNDLIKRGVIYYWGTSEWSATQLQQARTCARELKLEPPVLPVRAGAGGAGVRVALPGARAHDLVAARRRRALGEVQAGGEGGGEHEVRGALPGDAEE